MINEQLKKKAMEIMNMEGLISTLDMQLTSLALGDAVGEITIEDKHKNLHGGVHGGTIFALADTIAGFAVFTYGKSCYTVNSSIEYMRSTLKSEKIICHAHTTKYGKTIAWVECEILDEKGRVLGSTKSTYYLLDDMVQ
ncbi:MAG: PaaI family thioesterase [Firmicutes bacterium]|nr:PaaI family thioesterase [Bacillota bacterium]